MEAVINLGIIALLDDLIHYRAPIIPLGFTEFELSSRIWAKIISSVIVVISNYYISKLFVFKKKKQSNSEATDEN